MSTYNGDRFLREQLDSIVNQDNNDWCLYIRDDGSLDRTLDIIKEYVSKYDNIYSISDNVNKGAAMSFLSMLEVIESEYYMFCDQDDVWFQNKVSSSLDYFNSVCKDPKKDICLVFSDAQVVDQNLNVIDKSFWKFSKSFPEILKSNTSLIKVFNCAPGCTMFFNENLKMHVTKYGKNMLMHDWFLMLKAIEFGEVFYIDKQLMLYRQHSSNVLGADKTSYSSLANKFLSIKKTIKHQKELYKFVEENSKTNLLEYYYLKTVFNFKRFLYF